MTTQPDLLAKIVTPQLKKQLREICAFAEKFWEKPFLYWFTNHDVEHSKEIIRRIEQIIVPLEGTDKALNEHETFILLASAYLHDIGMQYLKYEGKSPENFTAQDYNAIRKLHAQSSYELIRKGITAKLDRDDVHFPDLSKQYIPIIALVSKGHSGDFFEEVVNHFEKTPYSPDNCEVRGGLLTALLLIADELDLHARRANFDNLKNYTPSSYTFSHWYRHHYVEHVAVVESSVKLLFEFPDNAGDYASLVISAIETKIEQQISFVEDTIRKATGRILLNRKVEINQRVNPETHRRSMPEGVQAEFRKLLDDKAVQAKSASGSPPTIASSSYTIVPPEKPVSIFTGRKEDLERFKSALAASPIISIEGIGGIGKTQFAAKCIADLFNTEKVVWFKCTTDTQLDSLIEASGFPDVLKGENKTELARYAGFLSLIEKHEKIIFVDDFQEVTDKSFAEFIRFAHARLEKAKIVLIDREHPNISGVHIAPVQLEGLGSAALEYAKNFCSTYYQGITIDNDTLQGLCDKADGHPLSIGFAIQLLSYGALSDDIIVAMMGTKQGDELSKRLLAMVFDHPLSTEAERAFMLTMSVLRGSFVPDAEVHMLGCNYTAVRYRLIEKHMLTLDDKQIRMHPVVREFCYARLKDKMDSHKCAASYLALSRTNVFDSKREEEIFHHLALSLQTDGMTELLVEYGEEFIIRGQTNTLLRMIEQVEKQNIERHEFELFKGDIAQVRGEWDKALKHFEKASSSSELSVCVDSYIKYGEMLYRRCQINDALTYFEGAYKSCKGQYPKGEARSLNDIGLVNRTFGDLKVAMQFFSDALKIQRSIDHKEGIANTVSNTGHILYMQGKLNEAMNIYNEALDIYEEIENKNGFANSLLDIGGMLFKQGKLNEAMNKYNEALKICEEIGDRPSIATSLNNIGRVLCAQDKHKEAKGKFNTALKISEEIGNRRGISSSLNNIAGVLRDQKKFNEALDKYNEALIICNEIGDRRGISICLNNIGVVLSNQGKLNKAMEKYNEALKIDKEIGDQVSMSTCYHNIGTAYYDEKKYVLAFKYLLESSAMEKEMGIIRPASEQYIYELKNGLGGLFIKKHREHMLEAFEAISERIKPYLDISKFFVCDTIKREAPKVGRNDLCPCGSGKKFKRCCSLTA